MILVATATLMTERQ